jgi:hypothetical protein
MTTTATRSTWKGHGNPQFFTYHGRGSQAGQGVLVAKVEADQGLTLRYVDGGLIDRFGAATKFWAAPAIQPEPASALEELHAQVYPEGKAAQRLRTVKEVAATAAKPGEVLPATSKHVKSVALCTCGCGQRAQRQYKQGHDARHASQVAKAILADPEADPAGLLAALPTDKLRLKAAAIVARKLPTG